MSTKTHPRRTRERITLSAFRGMDLSGAGRSGRFELSGNPATGDTGQSLRETADLCHAEELLNFICRDGVLRKRSGWREVLRVPQVIKEDGSSTSAGINGIFPFREGEREVTLLHAGRRFYRLSPDGTLSDITQSGTHTPSAVDPTALTDTPSAAFARGGRLYLVGCGDYLVYGRFPGTGGYELRRVRDGEETYLPVTHRAAGAVGSGVSGYAAEPPNTLSTFRKNTFTGQEGPAVFNLDARPDPSGEVTLFLTVTDEAGRRVTHTYRNTGADRTVFQDESGEKVGELEESKGQIVLEVSSTPPEGESENLTVLFPVTLEAPVTQCRFGVVYGEGGTAERLFLSGNPEACHTDYYSAKEDYTYFAPGWSSTVGSDASAILGYARAADGRLAVYKEESPFESAVYVRSGTREGQSFPALASGMTRGAVSARAFGRLGGESLFLSREGVFALTFGSTGPSAHPRSRPVDARLNADPSLAQAVATVFGDRYYLSLSGVTYVADGGYRRKYADGTVSFEWFYFDNTPVRVFGTYGGQLAFGTEEGRLCVFDGQAFSDRTYEESPAGQLLLSVLSNRVLRAGNSAFCPSAGDKVVFRTPGLYGLLLGEACVREGRVCTDSEQIFRFHEGMTVYADRVGESGLLQNTPYTVSEIDPGGCTFSLFSGQTRAQPSAGGFALCQSLTGQTLYVCDPDESGFGLRTHPQGGAVSLFAYDGQTPAAPVAVFTHEVPVTARFLTPAFAPGGHDTVKTLLSMTVTALPESGGSLTFGYETRQCRAQTPVRGTGQFSFENFSFERLSFDTGFENSYTVRVLSRHFNYIRFLFSSQGDTDCALCRFTAGYKIIRKSKGVT